MLAEILKKAMNALDNERESDVFYHTRILFKNANPAGRRVKLNTYKHHYYQALIERPLTYRNQACALRLRARVVNIL